MAQVNLYTSGSRIWIQDKDTWKSGVILKDCDGITLKFKTDDDALIKTMKPDPLPPLRNPDILIGLNDLTSLSYLHEPGVLYNLKYRFTEMKTIYTYCGIVLVAINPYEKLDIYGVETMWTYRGHAIGELDPHVFAVAEEAFKEMERASLNQSIIVSGESGAGKTVSAKYAMRYFATVGGAESVTSIERKVLASQPIMEAIGNAKTTRNDNSSRFGKYVELQFNSSYSIIGASMRTYLLEKSRVVFQAPGERNYHIFYQILTSTDDEVSDLSLSDTSFNYTKTMTIKGVDDASQFTETVQSMKLLGFGIDDRRNYFKLLAGILHLGNVKFVEKGEGCAIVQPSTPLSILCNLLSISMPELSKWLTVRRIRSAHEEFLKPMTVAEAEFSRDALSKLLYDLSFNWIVDRVNETLKSNEDCFKFIGVLDIYGFETFTINSFEQFCINYANEKLQQQFNSHMFKLDQEEYAKESIEWTFIDFYDNQPCIDLIEAKLGILALLDEETRMPAANDKSWTMKLYNIVGKSQHFKTPKRADGEGFTIVHFANEVDYTSSGFLEKNRDTVLADQIEAVKSSTNPFVASMMNVDIGAARKKTVSTQFRSSLTSLMASLNSTTPHYIRCIKPNDEKLAFNFEDSRALQQLRACGVLETVRIQASGFPTRWTYIDFAKRYRVLCNSKQIKRNDQKTTSIGILERQILDSTTYKLGTTKIFFRSGVLAYLEKLRSAKLHSCIILIQKLVRGWLQKTRYEKIKRSVALLQRYGRGVMARRRYILMKQTAAAITIQKYTRMYLVRKEYLYVKYVVTKFQSYCRMRLAVRKAQELRIMKATLIIQKNIRMFLCRQAFQRARNGIILLQCCTRRFIAKKQLKVLKLEARSLERVKALNKGLENKIIELQLKVEGEAKLNQKIQSLSNELAASKTQMQLFKQIETKYKQLLPILDEKANSISSLEAALKQEKDDKMDLVFRNKKLEEDTNELKSKVKSGESEISLLQAEVKKLNQLLLMNSRLNPKMKDENEDYELNNGRNFNESPSHIPTMTPQLTRRETHGKLSYSGYIKYDPADEHMILKAIVVDYKPQMALNLDPPTLPAYIILMMIKYIDSLNDDSRITPFFKDFMNMVKKVVVKRNQLEYNMMWVGILLRLLHILKQYSGDPQFGRDNSLKQNEQCLVNFDLVEFRDGFYQLLLWVHTRLIKNLEDRVQPFIVPAILESSSELNSTIVKDKASNPMEALKRELTTIHELLVNFQVDSEVICQIFRQIFYYLTAASMNNLLLRKDLCNWNNGIQIRYNVSTLEEWCRNKNLETITSTLQPLIQASRLLQAKKTDKDIDAVCDMCDQLTVAQVIKILHLFTADEEELRISSSFIKQVQQRLSQRKGLQSSPQQLLMDTKHVLRITYPYHPSGVKLDEINIPDSLGISDLIKKV